MADEFWVIVLLLTNLSLQNKCVCVCVCVCVREGGGGGGVFFIVYETKIFWFFFSLLNQQYLACFCILEEVWEFATKSNVLQKKFKSFFFWQIFITWWPKENSVQLLIKKIFVGKKRRSAKVLKCWGIFLCGLKSPYLNIGFSKWSKYCIACFFKEKLYFPVWYVAKIWLIHLVDDHQCG